MKETIKTGILLFFVIVFAIFFASTKGSGELNWDIKWPEAKEEFSYDIYPSEYNGQYKNINGNKVYAFVGKNADDTYRVYFIDSTLGKNVILKLDSNTLKNEEFSFVDTTSNSNLKMKLRFSENSFTVEPDGIGFSNEKIGGSYIKTKDIKKFAFSEFEIDIKQKK